LQCTWWRQILPKTWRSRHRAGCIESSFRDEAPKEPQVKIKCTSCGCWCRRGGQCYHCGARGPSAPPHSRAAAESMSRSPSHIGTTRHQSFREEAADKPHTKIRCASCGCWATRGESCYYCKTRASSSPPNSPAAAESLSRSSTRSPSGVPLNHSFRDVSAKKPQVKIRCTSCGCWAKRGGNCYFCKTPAPLFPPSAMSASNSIVRPPSGMSSTSNQSFREESSKAPQTKIKCTACGCWAQRGGQCYFCKSAVASCPPSSTSAAESITRTPSGMSLGGETRYSVSKSASSSLLNASPRRLSGASAPTPRTSTSGAMKFQPPSRRSSEPRL